MTFKGGTRGVGEMVTSHLGDKPSGRQPTGRHILVNWATRVETTGPCGKVAGLIN